MTISEVSKQYNLSVDTLRWYEKIGLLKDIRRTKSGLRDYSEENCRAVEFIKCMREAGVSIEFLLEYLELFDGGDATIEKRKSLLITQKEILKQKVVDLQKTIQRLEYKIENYHKFVHSQEKILKK